MPLPSVLAWGVLAAAAVVAPLLFFVTAPYGRHLREGWGPTAPGRWSWAVMEAVSLAAFGLGCFGNPGRAHWAVALLAALFAAHYVNRSLVGPLLARGEDKRMPLSVAAMAVAFNSVNGWSNGAALFPQASSARLWAGVALFAVGAAVNLHSDAVLRGLRRGQDRGYHVPHAGLHRLVASPNYLGELVEWGGFAVAAWTLPALAFFVFTAANLVPRAAKHLAWYRATFPEYPKARKALVPGLF